MDIKRWAFILALSLGIFLTACGGATREPRATVAPLSMTTVAPAEAEPASTAKSEATAVPNIDLGPPTQAVDTFLSRVRAQQYAEVEPLMTDLLRDAFVQGAGSVEAGFQMTDQRDGKLVAYRVGTARATSETSASVDVELESERVTTRNTIEVVNENGTWKVANITTR